MPEGIYCGEQIDSDGREKESRYYGYDRHGLIIGPTGCGKSTSFLMGNLLGDSLNGMSTVTIDPKAELAAVCALKRARHGEVRIIDPFGVLRELVRKHPQQMRELDQRGLVDSCGFNPLASLAFTGASFFDDCAAIGEALIKVEGSDPHWAESAQGLLVGLIMWEKIKHRDRASLTNVRLMLTEPEKEEATRRDGKEATEIVAGLRYHVRRIIDAHAEAVALEEQGQRGCAPAATLEIAASLVARFEKPTDETRSIVSTADTQTRWLLSPLMKADLEKPGLDFRDLKRKPVAVFVVLPSSRLRTHAVWLRLVIVTALRRLYVAEGVRTMMFIDEMPALGHLPPLVDAFALVRGYNIGLVGIAQDLNQLKALYKDHWESFVANAGYIVCWGPNDLTTAEWMSKRGGQETRVVRGRNTSTTGVLDPSKQSYGESESLVDRPRHLPQELIAMQRGVVMLFLAGLSDGIWARLQHYKNKRWPQSPGFNPYNP